MHEDQDSIRLQRYLSLAGHCSRRKAEELILQGRVSVNGRIVDTLGTKVPPGRARVEVDGKAIRWQAERTYILLHKPVGYITSLDDPADRPIVTDLLPKGMPRIYPVGRLDWDSEGALLLTNDGDLAHALMHPSKKVLRIYEVKLKGEVNDEGPIMKRLRDGITLDDGFMKPDRISALSFTGRHTWLQFHIHEGRNRILRRLCEAVGHPVLKLKRTQIGPISLSSLPVGAFRNLTSREIFELYEAVGLDPNIRPPEAGHSELGHVQLYKPSELPKNIPPPSAPPRRSSSRSAPPSRPGSSTQTTTKSPPKPTPAKPTSAKPITKDTSARPTSKPSPKSTTYPKPTSKPSPKPAPKSAPKSAPKTSPKSTTRPSAPRSPKKP